MVAACKPLRIVTMKPNDGNRKSRDLPVAFQLNHVFGRGFLDECFLKFLVSTWASNSKRSIHSGTALLFYCSTVNLQDMMNSSVRHQLVHV